MSNIPKKINLKPDEEIKGVIHRSLWYWWIIILLALIFILLPFFLIFPLFQFGWWGMGIFTVLVLVGIVLMLKVCINYQKNIFIMTNKRIIDIDHQGLFSNVVSSTIYSKIQDVTYKTRGVSGLLFHLGDIFISFVDNQKVQLKLPSVKYPEKIVSEILSNQGNFLSNNKKEYGNQDNQAQIVLNKIKSKMDSDTFNKLVSD